MTDAAVITDRIDDRKEKYIREKLIPFHSKVGEGLDVFNEPAMRLNLNAPFSGAAQALTDLLDAREYWKAKSEERKS